ncbi:MAG TPA: phytanoyl-CoA dioxygenase family protein [Solirubrobacteraceae bacterium]|nr:phytanoyl-CoA dioxygenase family protein [Solirubrobacteraceae bacterium]
MSTASKQASSLPGVDREAFRRRGYTIVEQLFGAEEVEQLREVVLDTLAEYERDGRAGTDPGREGTIRGVDGDLLSIPSLRHVLLDPRLLRVVRELLGGSPDYFGDSSVRVGRNGARGWHRDNVNRRRWRGGPDWHDPYPLLRCGVYMQDQARFSGGLALRPGSNRPRRRLPTLGRLVRAQAGDLVVWDLRTVHSGEVVRMRGLPRLALHPRLQTLLPDVLRVREERERVVMFMTFALPGEHLDNYVAYLQTRDYMRAAWARARVAPEVWAQAESAGLNVLRSIPEYSALSDRPEA